MKKFLRFFLILALVLISTTALAAGKLTATQENLRVLPFYGSYYVYFYAEVTNAGDKTVRYEDGLLELYDAQGDTLESSGWLNMYPKTLEPGETGYLWTTLSLDNIENPSDVADYALTLVGKGSNENPVHIFPSSVRYEKQEDGWWTTETLYTILENDTQETVYDTYVVMVLKDGEGKLLWCDCTNTGAVGLLPGTSAEVRDTITYDSIIQQLQEDGLNLGELSFSCIAFCEES